MTIKTGDIWMAVTLPIMRLALVLAAPICASLTPAIAQGVGGIVDIDENVRIEQVRIAIQNPSGDSAINGRVIDAVRRTLGVFPGDLFSRTRVDFALVSVRRQPLVAATDYSVDPGASGGVNINLRITLATSALGKKPGGMLPNGSLRDFPVLYDWEGTYVKLRLEALSMYYGNNNAWYGRPDVFLKGNPLVAGTPAGSGYSHWAEGFIHAGIYGITPITDNLNAYAGFSSIQSGSVGQELFTDLSRSYFGVEDAFVGLVGGRTGDVGDRLIFNASVGRQRFTLGDGFLIMNTAQNGEMRAALQSNPRWSADLLGLAQVRYNNVKAEVFYLKPDELPVVDSETALVGANVEAKLGQAFDLAGSYLYVPESKFSYFTTTQTFSRQGLRVWDARLRWQPNPAGTSGVFWSSEAAVQTNEHFPMLATAFYGELGYSFAELPWSPTISYRYAQFSGDNPTTSRFERWDPLYSGGTGEQWVQGLNHFKLFQDSNLVSHRFQLRLRPSANVELVPQFWMFRADSLANLGGNPGLSFLGSNALGSEINLTAKWFVSRNVMLQGHVAATFPGEAVVQALGQKPGPWLSTMGFLRIAY
ncbi:alginate export family protein [Bradyrhizobium japonicum]|uniref:alginate export family protein n=1 Tax=Bradyrhizobium japonicum TaxID=375 RepID=UPI001BA50484|nr:alginate export family protein [Bradyrhizobium japonicum]MBR0989791.1 alginate export family protein [Bradyrhizobium japonicum]